jgi:hypothetical protein
VSDTAALVAELQRIEAAIGYARTLFGQMFPNPGSDALVRP